MVPGSPTWVLPTCRPTMYRIFWSSKCLQPLWPSCPHYCPHFPSCYRGGRVHFPQFSPYHCWQWFIYRIFTCSSPAITANEFTLSTQQDPVAYKLAQKVLFKKHRSCGFKNYPLGWLWAMCFMPWQGAWHFILQYLSPVHPEGKAWQSFWPKSSTLGAKAVLGTAQEKDLATFHYQ